MTAGRLNQSLSQRRQGAKFWIGSTQYEDLNLPKDDRS